MVCVARNPEVPGLPDGEGLPRVSVRAPDDGHDDASSSPRRSSSATAGFSSPAARGRPPRGLLGVSRRQVRRRRVARRPASTRELREELDVEARSATRCFTTTHDYPDRRVELHFLRCELRGEPAPQLGQEMRWVARDELAALEFPPADAELIRLLAAGRPDSRRTDRLRGLRRPAHGAGTNGSAATPRRPRPSTVTVVPGSTKVAVHVRRARSGARAPGDQRAARHLRRSRDRRLRPPRPAAGTRVAFDDAARPACARRGRGRDAARG